MDNPGIYSLGDRGVTVALTDQVITEGAAASGAAQAFIDRLENVGSVTLSVEFDYGSGGTTCVVVVQTSINQGADWIDIARFDFAQANRVATATVVASAADATTVAALSAEGKRDILGDRLRAKVTTTGTYAGNTTVGVRAAVREGGVAGSSSMAALEAFYATLATITHASVATSTSSAEVLAANANARYRCFQNKDTAITITLNLGGTVVAGVGIVLVAGQSYEMSPLIGNLFKGSVKAISASGTPALSVTEGV